jgi:hypothetical protein
VRVLLAEFLHKSFDFKKPPLTVRAISVIFFRIKLDLKHQVFELFQLVTNGKSIDAA